MRFPYRCRMERRAGASARGARGEEDTDAVFLCSLAQCVESSRDDVHDGPVMLEGLRHHEADPWAADDQNTPPRTGHECRHAPVPPPVTTATRPLTAKRSGMRDREAIARSFLQNANRGIVCVLGFKNSPSRGWPSPAARGLLLDPAAIQNQSNASLMRASWLLGPREDGQQAKNSLPPSVPPQPQAQRRSHAPGDPVTVAFRQPMENWKNIREPKTHESNAPTSSSVSYISVVPSRILRSIDAEMDMCVQANHDDAARVRCVPRRTSGSSQSWTLQCLDICRQCSPLAQVCQVISGPPSDSERELPRTHICDRDRSHLSVTAAGRIHDGWWSTVRRHT